MVVSTPQAVALADAKKGVAMFMSDAVQVPVLGIVENKLILHQKNYQIINIIFFGKEGARNLAEDLDVRMLGEIPLVQSIREAGDFGRPAALQEDTPLANAFEELARNVVEETVKRNDSLCLPRQLRLQQWLVVQP